MRSIAIISGKGGSGKSSVSLNLGIALSLQKKKTLLIDADVAMANIGILLGVERPPISLQNVLLGEASARDAIFSDPGSKEEVKLSILASSLSIDKLSRLDFRKLKEMISGFSDFEFVLIDCPPGISEHSDAIMKAVEEAIIVLTPDPSGLASALKVKLIAEKNNVKILGFVVNKVQFDKSEISKSDLESVLGAKELVSVPEDFEVRKSTAVQVPLLRRSPNSASGMRLRELASFLTNEKPAHIQEEKKNVFAALIEKIGEIFSARQNR